MACVRHVHGSYPSELGNHICLTAGLCTNVSFLIWAHHHSAADLQPLTARKHLKMGNQHSPIVPACKSVALLPKLQLGLTNAACVICTSPFQLRRSAAFLNLGLSIEPSLGSGPPRITMLKKKGRRALENADEIMTHLATRFPHAAFSTLDGDAVATMSMKEQVCLLAPAYILPCCSRVIWNQLPERHSS